MPRLAGSYSAFGQRPLPPIRSAHAEHAIYVLEDTAQDLRADAKLRARVHPEEGEGAEAQAAILEAAIAILRGGEAQAMVDGGPEAHFCVAPGCGAPASNGFGFAGERMFWACREHGNTVEEMWRTDRAEREARSAEALRPTNNMAGIGGRLV